MQHTVGNTNHKKDFTMKNEKIVKGFSDESPVTVVIGHSADEVSEATSDILHRLSGMKPVSITESNDYLDHNGDINTPVVATGNYESFDDIGVAEYVTLERIIKEGVAKNVVAVVGVVSQRNSVESITHARGLRRLVLDNALVLDSGYAMTMFSKESAES